MPSTENESEDNALLATEEAPAPAPAPPAEPAYDPRAEIQALRQEMAQREAMYLQTLREGFSQAAQPQAAPAPELSDEQIEQMLAEGRGAQAIRQMLRTESERTKASVRRESVDPLAELVNVHGVDAIASHSRMLAEQAVDPTLKPYIARYRQEIDAAINGMAPQLRLNVNNVRFAYNLILGNHMQEILEEERQKVIRQVREHPESLPGAAVGRQQGKGSDPAVPTADELFGRNSPEAKMVRQAGGEDKWIAKHATSKFASKTWEEYVQRFQRMQGQGEGNA